MQHDWGKHRYTRYIKAYKVYSITRVNMGTQDIYGYTGYTGYIGVYRVYNITRVSMGTQNI